MPSEKKAEQHKGKTQTKGAMILKYTQRNNGQVCAQTCTNGPYKPGANLATCDSKNSVKVKLPRKNF